MSVSLLAETQKILLFKGFSYPIESLQNVDTFSAMPCYTSSPSYQEAAKSKYSTGLLLLEPEWRR